MLTTSHSVLCYKATHLSIAGMQCLTWVHVGMPVGHGDPETANSVPAKNYEQSIHDCLTWLPHWIFLNTIFGIVWYAIPMTSMLISV